jgi:hypothetical protein
MSRGHPYVAGHQSNHQKDWHKSTNNAKISITPILEEAQSQSTPERYHNQGAF